MSNSDKPEAYQELPSDLCCSNRLEHHCVIDCEPSPVLLFDSTISTWSYVKLLLWNIITGLLRCGTAVLESSFGDHWSVTSSSESECEFPNSSSVKEKTVQLSTTERERTGSVYETPVYPTSSGDILITSNATCVNIKQEILTINELIDINSSLPLHEIGNVVDHFEKNLLYDLGVISRKTDDFAPYNLQEDFLYENISSSQPPYTLLSSLYVDCTNGIIDNETLNLSIEELVRSVIPRNLSDSSEITVTPAIRKMYAWTNIDLEHSENKPNDKEPDASDLSSTLAASDEPFAYPGKLTMFDGSFSPLSPVTTNSSTLTNSISPDAEVTSAFPVSTVDRQDDTLAWAMSNLNIGSGDRDELAGRPPLPNSLGRQSRDKSPARTVNSFRLPERMSVPALLPYEGYQLLDKPFDQDFDINKPKRSSSLKSQRTPPGTPGQKAVRFADALGLDLETVRHVFDQEAPPKIPASATFDLELDTDESIAKIGAKQFGLCFAQPSAASNFIRRVLGQMVCLEDAHVNMPRGVLTGTIRVRSVGFEKRIFVRITYNNWATYFDNTASYIQGSHDGVTDRFSFSVVFPDTMVPGDRAQFAIRYETHSNEQFWDNNHGQNYSVSCYAKATDLAGDGSWVHYL